MTNRFGDTFHGEQWLYDVGGAASGSGIVIKKQTILGEPVFVSVSGHYNFEGTDLYLACHIHVLRIYKSSERFGEIGGYRRIHFDPNDRSQLACLNENERIVFHPANSFRADAGASKEVQALIQENMPAIRQGALLAGLKLLVKARLLDEGAALDYARRATASAGATAGANAPAPK